MHTHGHGWVFSANDFLDLGSRDAVDKTLSRMAATASIRRVARGLYDVPRRHPIVALTAPSVDNVFPRSSCINNLAPSVEGSAASASTDEIGTDAPDLGIEKRGFSGVS